MSLFDDDNLGILGGAAQAVKAGIQGYQDAEDRQYNRRIMAAKMKAAETEAARKKDDDDIQLATHGYKAKRDAKTGLITRNAEGIADITQDPLLTPTFKPLHPIIEQEKEAQIRALGEKPFQEQQKLIADKNAQGFEPVMDPETGKRIVSWKMAPWKQEQESAETAYKKALTAKAGRKGGEGTAGDLFKRLPPENQVQIKDLANSIAKQRSIYNALSGDMNILESDAVTPEKKLVHARSMIKTLNSTQGQDAVGVEEARRLAGLLEFRLVPRIGEPGPLFGRADISEFRDQIKNKMDAMSAGMKLNNNEIQSLYGRSPLEPDATSPNGGLIKPGLINGPKGLIQPKAAAPLGKGPIIIQPIPGVTLTLRQTGALNFIKTNPEDERTPAWIELMRKEGVIR